MNLINYLKKVPDFRTQPRYPLWVVLLLVIMGTMSNCLGYRALGDFADRHKEILLELMGLPNKRLPSYSTIRRVMIRIDYSCLTEVFNDWVERELTVSPKEQVAVDGKSIKASLKDYDKSYQDFVTVVSAFSIQQGLVVGLQPMHNKEASEIVTVQTLLKALQLKDICFSFDALHAQKKTVKQIVDSGNVTRITVKGNQPSLLKNIKARFEQNQPTSINSQKEKTRNRICERKVYVLDNVEALESEWSGIQRIIKVERSGTRDNKPFEETFFYISSMTLDARGFADYIRKHWHIENRLHWPKDVVLKEDEAPLCDGYAPANFAILRTIAVNLFRLVGFASITKGIRYLSHDVHRLFFFFQ